MIRAKHLCRPAGLCAGALSQLQSCRREIRMVEQRVGLMRPRKKRGATLLGQQLQSGAGIEYFLQDYGCTTGEAYQRDRDQTAGRKEGQISPGPIVCIEPQ